MVTSDNHSWFVFRRYNEFYKLYEMLKKQVNIMYLMNTDSIIILLVLYKTVTLNKEHEVQVFENDVLLDH
jgi:PX domain.